MALRWFLGVPIYLLLLTATDGTYGLTFLVEPSDQVVAIDQFVSLDCQAEDGLNIVTYSWTFNGVSLLDDENLVVSGNGSLLIEKMNDLSVGSYTCLATSGEFTQPSRAATLELAYINPTFSVQPMSQNVTVGDRVVLSCYIESLPTASVEWTVNDEAVSSGTVTQDSNGTSLLEFTQVMYDNVGTYTCIGTNPMNGVFRYSNDATLEVRDLSFIVEPSDKVVALNQSVSLNCQAEDDANVDTYSWTFNGASLPDDENLVVSGNGSLLIAKMNDHTVGSYTCLATVGEFTLSSSPATLELAYINPTFSVQPMSQNVTLGDRVVLSCYIESLPTASVEWTLNDEAVSSGTVTQDSNGTSLLEFDQAMYYNVGTYTCIGTNPINGVFRYSNDATLEVRDLSFIVEPSDQVVALNQFVSLDCQAEDDASVVTYSWTFNGASLPDDENLVVSGNGSLLIENVNDLTVGSYICLATAGEFTLSSRPATLELAYINPTFSVQPMSQNVTLGDRVVLSCYIESLPTASVEWTLNGEAVSSGTVTQDSNGASLLEFYPVMYYNVGTYKCTGTNPMNGVFRYSNDATLEVRGLPVFLSSLKPVSVPLGFQATFVCNFYGNPTPEVLNWYSHYTSDNGSVTSDIIQNTTKYEIYENGTFIINDVKEEDEAFYTCNVKNDYGEISESAPLTVTGQAAPPEFMFTPHNSTVHKGNPVQFLCTCSGNPEPAETWEKNSIVVSENGSLTINEVQSTDTGVYTCLCENDVGTITQSVYLNVYVSPVITSPQRTVTVMKGSPISFDCSTTGNPPPTATWITPRFDRIWTSINGATLSENGSLHISSATLDDAGEYMCVASNIVDTVTMSVGDVTLEYSPEMTILPQSQGVVIGSKVYLHCQANGSPDPTYNWLKEGEGQVISSHTQIYLNNTLMLHSVTKQDEGTYKCLASNKYGQTQALATITVSVPPSFTTVPQNDTVLVGSSAKLSCKVDGDPVPTQKWMKDDKELVLEHNVVLSQDQSELTISAIEKQQFGKYTCIASNIAGTGSVSAWILGIDVPVFTSIPKDTVVDESSTVILTCASYAIETPSVIWFKGRVWNMTVLVNNDRISASPTTGTLVIQSVNAQKDEGWYTCKAMNSVGSISTEVHVDVKELPRILTTNSPRVVLIGSSVELTCQSTGDPTPSLQWSDPRSQLLESSSTYLVVDDTLHIGSVSENDAGNWICQACNHIGCDMAVVELRIRKVPVFTMLPEDTVVDESSTLTLMCQGYAIETPSVIWFKGRVGNMTLLVDDDRITTDAITGRLDIQSVNAQDEGWYTCNVQNIAGSIYAKALVVVNELPRIVTTNSPQMASINSSVDLTCQFTGEPTPSLQWSAPPGQVITNSSAYLVMDNTLHIVSIRAIDEGNWSCEACNQLGCDTASVQLQIEGRPTISSFTGFEDDRLMNLECIVEGNPMPSVSFTSQGQSVTSALQGHVVRSNRILVETEFLKEEYRCIAENEQGSTFKTISVPTKMEPPSATNTASGTVTLSWNEPSSQGNLPLTGYLIQIKSNTDVSWQPVQSEGHDLVNERSFEVIELEADQSYSFRIAARNLLGLAEYSEASSTATIQPTAPSPPQNVLALQVDEGVVLLMWDKSQYLNAPLVDVVYEYKVVKPATTDGKETEVVHVQGTLTYNQTFQVEITDLTEPVLYTASILAKNIKLNKSSDPVLISLYMTSGYLDPQPHSDKISFGRDQVIATVAGIFGGIIIVIIIVFIVTRVRNQKKSKSLSLLHRRMSLDQFYMENPKTLYNDDKYSSKRKSGHSFYSFDESFQSTMGSKGRRDGSVEFLGSTMSSDVLLVSRSPLHTDTEPQRLVSHATSKDKLYTENIQETACVQDEIELPECDIALAQGAVARDQGLVKTRKGTDEVADVVSNSGNNQELSVTKMEKVMFEDSSKKIISTQGNPGESVECDKNNSHFADNQCTHKQSISAKSGNSSTKEQCVRVSSLDHLDTATQKTAKLPKDGSNSVESSNKLDKFSRDRCSKSASPVPPTKGSDSNQHKPPVRVLSLDLLSPSVKSGYEKHKKLKLLSESMVKKKNDLNKRYKQDVRDVNNGKDKLSKSAIENCTVNGLNDSSDISGIVEEKGPLCNNTHHDTDNVEVGHVGEDLNVPPVEGKCDGIIEDDFVSNGKELLNFTLRPQPKNVQDDNFLTEAEIKQEVVSALLY